MEKIIILSDDANQKVGRQLYEELGNQSREVKYISTSNVDVKPCYSCGGCTNKTYGKCIIRDDGDKIYPSLLESHIWVIVTPLIWGTYSFCTKRVLDKVALIGDRHYYVKGKELVKSMQGNLKNYYVIGVKDKYSLNEKESFTKLVKENVNIMGVSGGSFVVNMKTDSAVVQSIAKEINR